MNVSLKSAQKRWMPNLRRRYLDISWLLTWSLPFSVFLFPFSFGLLPRFLISSFSRDIVIAAMRFDIYAMLIHLWNGVTEADSETFFCLSRFTVSFRYAMAWIFQSFVMYISPPFWPLT